MFCVRSSDNSSDRRLCCFACVSKTVTWTGGYIGFACFVCVPQIFPQTGDNGIGNCGRSIHSQASCWGFSIYL